MRFGLVALAIISLVATSACVDGKTPDCSTPQSGCFPEDGSSGGDATSDANDASTSDAGDAAKTDAATDGSLLDVLTD